MLTYFQHLTETILSSAAAEGFHFARSRGVEVLTAAQQQYRGWGVGGRLFTVFHCRGAFNRVEARIGTKAFIQPVAG